MGRTSPNEAGPGGGRPPRRPAATRAAKAATPAPGGVSPAAPARGVLSAGEGASRDDGSSPVEANTHPLAWRCRASASAEAGGEGPQPAGDPVAPHPAAGDPDPAPPLPPSPAPQPGDPLAPHDAFCDAPPGLGPAFQPVCELRGAPHATVACAPGPVGARPQASAPWTHARRGLAPRQLGVPPPLPSDPSGCPAAVPGEDPSDPPDASDARNAKGSGVSPGVSPAAPRAARTAKGEPPAP